VVRWLRVGCMAFLVNNGGIMKKNLIAAGMMFFLVFTPMIVSAVETPPLPYGETLPQSAFQQGDTKAAVRMLLKANVPVSEIIKAAVQNGVSYDDIIGALLAVGIPPGKIVIYCLDGPIPFKNAVAALNNHGVPPDDILTWLINWKTGINRIYDACEFMLLHGYSQADVLKTLKAADADREVVIQVVRWFKIPPATVIAVYQERLDYFGHVFNRYSLPQPALLAIGVSRIVVDQRGPVISPMTP